MKSVWHYSLLCEQCIFGAAYTIPCCCC